MKISGKASVVLCTNNKKKAFRYDASQVMHTISFDFIKIFIFGAQNFNFDQTYLNAGLKTQNADELSLDMIFHNDFL